MGEMEAESGREHNRRSTGRRNKMKITNVNELEAASPCADGLAFARKFSTLAEAWEKCERGDWMLWVLRKTGGLDKRTSVAVAVACAERVLARYEHQHPGDNRPRAAIEAARNWLENPCEATRAYAAAAYAAAAAADAASSAAYGASNLRAAALRCLDAMLAVTA